VALRHLGDTREPPSEAPRGLVAWPYIRLLDQVLAVGRNARRVRGQGGARSWQNSVIVALSWSPILATSRRQKPVGPTPLGADYLAQQRAAARAIKDELRAEGGTRLTSAALGALLAALDSRTGCVSARAFGIRRTSDPLKNPS